jgi:hypothetical protein
VGCYITGSFVICTGQAPPRPYWLSGPTQPPIQWIPGDLSPGAKRPNREINVLPTSAEVKNAWSNISTSSQPSVV